MSSGGNGHEIILARHGQTQWNIAGRYQGQSNPPLSQQGIIDATRMAGLLRGDGLGQLISSPLDRAQQTARIVATRLYLGPVRSDARLAEINFGEWEGLTQEQVRLRWPDLLRTWKSAPDTVRFPGGESLAEARRRLNDFLQEIASRSVPDGQRTLIVTHTGLIRIAILDAGFQSIHRFRHIDVAPGSLHYFSMRGGMTVPLMQYHGTEGFAQARRLR